MHNAGLSRWASTPSIFRFVFRANIWASFEDAPALGISGLSVTIPHKELVVKRLNKADATTEGVGAANTLVYREKGIEGFNTDQQAAIDSLEAAHDLETDRQFDCRSPGACPPRSSSIS